MNADAIRASPADRGATGAAGPLAGLRVLEFGGIGPGPFACMLLSDWGADVVRLDRPGTAYDARQIVSRGRTAVVVDLKTQAGIAAVQELLRHADVLVEGFRPGVMERLGLGPDAAMRLNPELVYGRITGWGQEGPLAQSAGHDINYLAITGALDAIGPARGSPAIPLNLVGDYAGGSLYLVAGILAALQERQRSGQGQVVDAAIVDGAVSLMGNTMSQSARGMFREERGSNLLDGGRPYYGVYCTSDGRYVSIGAIEPQFFAELCERIGIPVALRARQNDPSAWTELREAFARAFGAHSQAYWTERLAGTDACLSPVLPLSEAARHPHLASRRAFTELGGVLQPAAAPRFSRTPAAPQRPPPERAFDIVAATGRWRASK